MKYTLQSGKYIFKNFPYVFAFALLPAVFLSISTDKGALTAVLGAFFQGRLSSWTFTELFRAISVLNFGSWQSIVFGLIGILVAVPCVALMTALLEKHFRIGKRTFNGLWSKLNDNFISTCGFAVLLVLIYEIWALIAAAILFFISRLGIELLAYILTVAFLLGLHFVLLYIVGTVYLWLPCMQITGFRALEALHYSYQLILPVRWRILGGQAFFLLLAEALICVCAWYIQTSLVFMLITTALYAFLIMLFCVRMEVAYFDRDHIQRADLTYYYQR
ncbi:MAG: hypothetical protein IJZ32_04125 [Clostridia bacterium]|nr:hypothetical protein [Clostridia bacterium]